MKTGKPCCTWLTVVERILEKTEIALEQWADIARYTSSEEEK